MPRLVGYARSAALAALGLAAVCAGPAQAAVTQLGPRPNEGGAGGISGTVSPSVVRVGESQTDTMTTSWSTFYSPNSENGPWITRTSTPNINTGGRQLVGNACDVLIYAGTTSCTYKATAATGGWRTDGFTIQLFGLGGSATYAVPYAILPPDTYDIGGRFVRRGPDVSGAVKDTPAAGITVIVEKLGDTEKYTTTTGAQGQYDVQVGEGQWRVRSTDRSFCQDIPGGAGGCSRQPTTTTGGDKTINFVQPAPITVTGTVTTDDATFVKDAKVRARQTDDDGNVTTKEAISDDKGAYKIDGLDPGADITFDSPVPYICPVFPGIDPKIGGDSTCEVPKRVVAATKDLVQDFQKPGCTTKIDFGSSMAAKSRCFKLDGPEKWSTDEPFRLNGIDFTPSGKVKFDKTARTVDWSEAGQTAVSLEVNKKSEALPPIPGVGVWSFETATTKITFNAGIPISPSFNFAGYPMSEQATVEMTSGVSNLTLKLTVPTDPAAQYTFLKNQFKGTATLGLSAKVTTDNDFGVRAVTGTLENPGNIGGLNTDAKFKNPLAVVKSVAVSYDWVADLWSFEGTFEPSFLKKGVIPGPSLDEDARGGSITGKITANGVPPWGTFQTLSASAAGLNRPIGPVYLQRLKASIPLSLWDSNSAGSFNVGLGVSAGPAQKQSENITLPVIGSVLQTVKVPAEKASIDADATVSWSNLSSNDDTSPSANDLQIAGTANLKIWDQAIGSGSFGWYPFQGYTTVNIGNIGLTDPTGGSLFAVRGEAGFTLDLRKEGSFYMGGRGNITFGGYGFVSDWLLVGASPTIFATCGEVFGVRVGGAINFDEIGNGYGGLSPDHGETCDLAPYRLLKPSPPAPVKSVTPPTTSVGADRSSLSSRRAAQHLRRAPAAKASQRFTVKGNEGVIPMELDVTGPGVGLPDLAISGPGFKQTLSGTKSVSTKSVVTMVFPAARRMQVFFKKLKKGAYTVTVQGTDGGLLAAPLFSRVLPQPDLETSLDASTCSPTIGWSGANLAGQTLRFVERTSKGDTVVGTSAAASGKLTIAALPSGGRAEIVAQVLNGQTMRTEQTVGSYTSSVGETVPGPSAVKVAAGAKASAARAANKKKSKGKTTKLSTVSWAPVCGAEAYSVAVSHGKAAIAPVVVTATSTAIPRPTGKGTITVTSLGRGRVAGGSTLVPVS